MFSNYFKKLKSRIFNIIFHLFFFSIAISFLFLFFSFVIFFITSVFTKLITIYSFNKNLRKRYKKYSLKFYILKSKKIDIKQAYNDILIGFWLFKNRKK